MYTWYVVCSLCVLLWYVRAECTLRTKARARSSQSRTLPEPWVLERSRDPGSCLGPGSWEGRPCAVSQVFLATVQQRLRIAHPDGFFFSFFFYRLLFIYYIVTIFLCSRVTINPHPWDGWRKETGDTLDTIMQYQVRGRPEYCAGWL